MSPQYIYYHLSMFRLTRASLLRVHLIMSATQSCECRERLPRMYSCRKLAVHASQQRAIPHCKRRHERIWKDPAPTYVDVHQFTAIFLFGPASRLLPQEFQTDCARPGATSFSMILGLYSTSANPEGTLSSSTVIGETIVYTPVYNDWSIFFPKAFCQA